MKNLYNMCCIEKVQKLAVCFNLCDNLRTKSCIKVILH